MSKWIPPHDIVQKIIDLTHSDNPPANIRLSAGIWQGLCGVSHNANNFKFDQDGVFLWYASTKVRPPLPNYETITITEADFETEKQ